MQRDKRLRVFAGPNGSGKSTFFEEFTKRYFPGYFINADEIEAIIVQKGLIDLADTGIDFDKKDLSEFKKTKEAKSLLHKAKKENQIIDIEVSNQFIVDKTKISNSYEASFIASFIRWLHIKNHKSFSFETVMSHPSKVEEIKTAQIEGYKTYLYFLCIDDVEINIDRVENRINKGGHNVDPEKIRSRYHSTLQNLYSAICYSNRAYLFDNSGKEIVLIAEIFEGVMKIKSDKQPKWFHDFVLPYFTKKS